MELHMGKNGTILIFFVLCFLALGGHCLQMLCLPGFGTHANTQNLPLFRAFPASIQAKKGVSNTGKGSIPPLEEDGENLVHRWFSLIFPETNPFSPLSLRWVLMEPGRRQSKTDVKTAWRREIINLNHPKATLFLFWFFGPFGWFKLMIYSNFANNAYFCNFAKLVDHKLKPSTFHFIKIIQ